MYISKHYLNKLLESFVKIGDLLLLKLKAQHSSFLPGLFFLQKAEINPSSTIKTLAKYYFVGLNDRLQCVHNDPVLVISSDLVRKSEFAICSPIRS